MARIIKWILLLWTILYIFSTVHCWPCPQNVTRVYARPGSRAVLAFQTTIQSESGGSTYYVAAFNGSNLYTATFYKGDFKSKNEYLSSTFIGDAATGNFTVQTNTLQTMDAGVYMLQYKVASVATTEKCSTLYILGIQTQPVIQSSNDPSVGDDATLTCESTSTTSPTNHSLSRSYNWNVDNSPVTSSGRYSLSGNTLAVSNVIKLDTNLNFTCTATEVVTNGYTSDSSGEYSINVLYGPDGVTLTPSKTNYVVDQDATLTDVKCYADCNSVCTYKWTKQGQATPVSSTDTLPLGIIQKSFVGTYTCTATNAARAITKNSSQVQLNVRYGPDAGTTTLTPDIATYLIDSGSPLNDITCAGDCYPACSYKWTKPGGAVDVSSTGVLSLGSLVRSEAAIYTCTVTNPSTGGYTTKDVTVNVRYGPFDDSTTSLSPSPSTTTRNEGDTLSDITCSADCYPACSYKWTKSGTNNIVSSTGVLSLETLNRTEDGTYTCTVTSSWSSVTVTRKVTVTVRYGPDAGTTTLSPATTTYMQNEETSLNAITCVGDCYPACSYKWTKPGTTVSTTGVLSLGTLSKNEAAIYTCTVTNTGKSGSVTKRVTVNVRYGPDAGTTTLSPATTTYTQNEGTSLNAITCVGDCYPACSYNWTKPGTTVSTTGVLSLGTLSKNEAAIYTCTVTNTGKSGSVAKRVTVNVRYGPDAGTTTLTPAASSYTRNESTVLPDITCTSDCYPACNIKWTKPGSVITNTGVLSLEILNRNEAATYTCTVSNLGTSGTVTKQVTVSVRFGPDTCDISVESPYTVREGNSISTITCQSDCYPTCSEGWNNISTNNPVGSDGDLSLGTVTRYKAGNYACTCSNIVQGSYSKSLLNTVHVIVQYPPDVSVLLSTTNTSEGKELILTCDAKGVPSVYNYNTLSQTWGHFDIHNAHSAANGTPMYSSLRIPSLQLQDSGTYTCHVDNGIKNTQGVLEDSVSSVFIKVKVSPKIFTQALRFAGVTGGTANIRVEFYSDPDILNVTFKRYDGLTITNGNKYNVSHYETEVSDNFHGTDVTLNGSQANIIISDLKPEDFGVYTLTLTNELSTIDTKVILGAESKPDEPTQFTHLYKDNAYIFSWIGGFNGGHNQTYLLQTSIVGTEEWVNRTTIAENDELYLQYNANISNLQPGTYTARIYSWNTKGVTDYVNLNVTFTIKSPVGTQFPLAAVAGGTSSAVVVLIIVGVVVVLYKRRYSNKGGSQAKLQKSDLNCNHNDDSDDEDEVHTDNPMYESADKVKPGRSDDTSDIYAKPIKNQEKNDIYAMVDKKPKADESDVMNLYQMPDKKGQKKQQKKEAKKNKKGKQKQQVDIYENAPEAAVSGANISGSQAGHGSANDENVYEDAEVSVSDQNPKKNLNIEGLIYADLTFNDQPNGQKKFVIHGLDSMTDYGEVDFTKKAERLPDSDEEKEK